MINLYDAKETDFSTNGLVVLDNCKSCCIIEENNGQYELELECVLDSRGKWKYLLEGNIVKADGQLFRIYRKVKTLNGIKINARHIFYDLLDNLIEEIDIRGLQGVQALDMVMSNTAYFHNFKCMSDITKVNDIYLDDEKGDILNKNPIEAIFFLIELYGGELVRDNFNIKWLQTRGQDRGVLISYGKNIKGIEETLNIDSVITRIKPIGQDGLTLDEKYVDSPYINDYPNPKIKIVEFSDCNDYESLRTAAKKYYEDTKCDIPQTNYKIDFIELSKTEEYKHYKVLETMYIGDTATVRHSRLNINLKCKVIKIKKDVLTNRMVEVELGNFKQDISNAFDSIENTLNKVSNTIIKNKTALNKAIDNATKLLTTALGGYVIKKENEILIMDTQDENTATKVWRWNLNGLGYSGTGVNGPYRLAITMDGSICADFITTGILDGTIVKAGSIKTGSLELNAQQQLGKVGTLETTLEAIPGKIDSKVSELQKNIESEITQQADKISLVVNENGTIDGDNLISAINLSTKKIEMSALNIDLSGYVTFNGLEAGTTSIDGACIKTGLISADRIDVDNLYIDFANITGSLSFKSLTDKPSIPSDASDVGAISDTYIDSNGVFTKQIYANNINVDDGKITAEQIDVDELQTQITGVGRFIYFNGNTVNGIGTMQSGDYSGYLGLVTYSGIYINTSNINTPDGKLATQNWVEENGGSSSGTTVAVFG